MRKAIDVKYVHSELSHGIIGCAMDVQNEVGPGLPEKTYQKLVGKEFFNKGYKYKEQVVVDLMYKGIKETTRRFDFVVENKIVVELKVGSHIGKKEYEQVREYLKMSGLKLGLIVLFSYNGVIAKRVVNLY
ncbi:GxxExxY protein [Candidatus Kuenenbacteria bacterium]|nr:GxxExxY protein [Candidatus Kuenenbacteria bacterium]